MMAGNSTSLPPSTASSQVTNFSSLCRSTTNRTPKTQPNLSYYMSALSPSTLHFRCNTFLSFPRQLQPTHFSFHSLLHRRNSGGGIGSVYALKKETKGGSNGKVLMEMSDFDEDDDEFDDLDYETEDYGDEDDEEMLLPFKNMQKWLENKPRGFGEGKVYDTSVEDKLLEEMEQSRKAQASNINSLRNNPIKLEPPRKDDPKKKEPEVSPSGIRVRVVNLPKKKNIHRDLKMAFKEVPGIVNIMPAVSGNKKTRDPVCKGFAFVDFKSDEDATRFVQLFSGQSVAFGKREKQIRCEMTKSHSSNSSSDELACSFHSAPELIVPVVDNYSFNVDLHVDDSSFEETDYYDSNGLMKEITENMESLSVSNLNGDDRKESMIKPTTSSSSSKKQNKNPSNKNAVAKGGGPKVPKLDIPGSAKRLKVKEKAVLTSVFSKYGLLSASASRERQS